MNPKNITKETNLKLTPARDKILQILISANKPMCYEDIKSSIDMNKATFYRNMIKFQEKNIVNSFESNDKKRYFYIENTIHPHFICNICNKIKCIKQPVKITIPNYQIDNIILKGKCEDCLNLY
jgi:Fur family ferric uptake transcriptional regulator